MIWRRLERTLLRQTAAERASMRNGVSLFFGALLGANLGTLAGLALSDYLFVILLLASVVMILEMVGRARSRRYVLGYALLYTAAIAYVWWNVERLVPGLSRADADKLFTTVGVWAGIILITELTPLAGEHQA